MTGPLRIWIDDQIADRDAFAPFGVVHPFSGRTVTRGDLAAADALIVRSVTRVDASLLDGTPVRFVGSVTAGADHLDTSFFHDNDIEYALATGFNARPVAEYVMAAIFLLAERRQVSVESWTLGIVGVGYVGSMVRDFARAIGITVLVNDPPREVAEGGDGWNTLEKVLSESDVVTLHVPLTYAGQHSTRKLIDADRIAEMRRNAVLINTSRGGVVDEQALLRALSSLRIGGAVIDTWENEPNIDSKLVERCEIATPHIAGHSIEARRRGSAMIRHRLVDWMARSGVRDTQYTGIVGRTPSPLTARVGIATDAVSSDYSIDYASLGVLSVREWGTRLAAACPLVELDEQLRAAGCDLHTHFDAIRAAAGRRHEISA